MQITSTATALQNKQGISLIKLLMVIVQEIAEDLEAALEQFATIAEDLKK